MLYADVIVDISTENLDKTYQYRIPERLEGIVCIGCPVKIPFGKGNRFISGYVLGITETPKCEVSKIKDLLEVTKKGQTIEENMLSLAAFIRENYGGTMNDALKTVMPVKRSVRSIEKKKISLKLPAGEAKALLLEYEKKRYAAKARLLEKLLSQQSIDFDTAIKSLKIPRQTITALYEDGIISVISTRQYRNPMENENICDSKAILNEGQQRIADAFKKDYEEGIKKTYLIHGVTGSGKTEVYMELIDEVISRGKQVIVLIPEIALTFQTVKRFQKRFLNRVTILNSRMSAGERFDQIERARNGEIDIMVGPRSALFTPFERLGLIIIDEEHESSYKSEMPPKYHAREVAIELARLTGSSVVLGSATPSLESYDKAKKGEYALFTLTQRAKTVLAPKVHIIDLKEELRNYNKSIFSTKLRELMTDRLEKHQQIMLFLNRRGFAGFVSCRSCGHVMKCPHCDISLTYHNDETLHCHYCGYETAMPKLCPVCQSRYIAAFGTGTQKVEALVAKEFPKARILRMDADTTKNKNSYEQILSTFAKGEADILIGTQMIVKGHDFEGVTLVGILAADLSLYASDYRASERTFQLLAQAIGRAGRGRFPGEVVIQTYQPEHYAIVTASTQDYESFFQSEMNYRKLLMYPPAAFIMAVLILSKKEEEADTASALLKGASDTWTVQNGVSVQMELIGPCEAGIAKINDVYRRILYVKSMEHRNLIGLKDFLEQYVKVSSRFQTCTVQYDFNPMSGY